MEPCDGHIPFRHATRLINAYQHDVSLHALAVVPRDLDGVALLLIGVRTLLKDRTCAHFNLLGIARSLGRPPETIRRAALRLVDRGFFAKHPRTVGPRPDLLEHPAIDGLRSAVVARMGELVAEMRDAGLPLPDGLDGHDDRIMCTAALDLYLSVYDLAEAHVGLPMRLHVLGTATVLNAEKLRRDPVLGRRYGYDRTVPPRHLRQPASLSRIVAAAIVPHATVWRHVTAAERDGVLCKVPGGYLLSDRLMDSEQISRRSRTKIRYVLRVLGDLARDRYASLPPDQLG